MKAKPAKPNVKRSAKATSKCVKPWAPARVAVAPDDWTLQIDIDSARAYKYFKNRINFFQARIRAYQGFHKWRLHYKVTRSINGNRHITIKSSMRLTICERICAQVLLGDDLNRGMYNFFRYLNGSRFPILFFEKRKNADQHIRRGTNLSK